jgi:hypothetical protein
MSVSDHPPVNPSLHVVARVAGSVNAVRCDIKYIACVGLKYPAKTEIEWSLGSRGYSDWVWYGKITNQRGGPQDAVSFFWSPSSGNPVYQYVYEKYRIHKDHRVVWVDAVYACDASECSQTSYVGLFNKRS